MLLPRTCSGHRFLRGVLFVLVLAASIATLLAATPVAFAQTEVPDAPTAVAVYSIETQKLEVRWSTSDAGSTTSFKIQWKSGNQEFEPSRQIASDPTISIEHAQSTPAGDRYVETIIGLNDGTEYTVRVIGVNGRGDSAPSATTTGTPAPEPDQAREFFENEVVKIFESRQPWLRETWNYITHQNVNVYWSTRRGGGADIRCSRVPVESNLRKCHTHSVFVGGRDDPRLIWVITHELAHVYTLANGVTTTPGPLGIARLYFEVLAYQASLNDRNCMPNELYADAVSLLTLGDRFQTQSTYWSGCSVTTDAAVTEQALDVVRSATAGQTPSWFGDTYDDPDGNPDLERVWRDVKAIKDYKGWLAFREATVFMMRDAFGGYCDNRKATESAFGSNPTRNPWKDGGCVPEAPMNVAATAVGSGKVNLSWGESLYDGGSPIEGYKVQWKSGTQEYDSSREATITDFLDLQHTISGLTNDESHSIRVLSYNHNGDGAAAEVTATPTATDTTVPVMLLARLEYAWVRLIWNEALDESSVPPSTAFTLNVNGRSTNPSVSIRGNVVTLTPGGVTSAVDSLTVSYTVPTGSGEMPLKDSAGNTAASFPTQSVRNDRIQVAFTSDPGPDKTYSWNGGHGKQDVIEAKVTFSEPVVVIGAPELKLEIGGNTRHAKYHSGSGTTALVFRYSLMMGEVDTYGIWVRTSRSISVLTGLGLVRYASTKATAPARFRDHLRTNHLVDAIPPTLEFAYAIVNGNDLNLRWSEALDEDSGTGWTFFEVQDTSNDTLRKVTAFSIRDSLVTLTLLSPVSVNDQLTVSYHDPFGHLPESVLMEVYYKPLTDTVGNSANRSTKTVAVIDLSYPARGAPTISGTAQVGETLTADTSGISDADGLTNPAFTYQWLSDDAAIQGANDFTYTLADNDEGKAIKVEVAFTDDGGNGSSLTSEPTNAVAARPNSPATGLPAIRGKAQVAETLTAFISDIEDADGLTGATFSYQWVSSDGTTDTDIPGATSATYTLVVDDIGKTITVRVNYTDDRGFDETLTSAPTDAVVPLPQPNNPATGAPTISGTAQVGETLTADITGIADADGLSGETFAYQWVSSDGTTDTDIEKATDSTYKLVASDQGRSVKVRVTFTDDGGNEETLTSAPTGPVFSDGPPGAPRNLTATAGNKEVTLSWDPPADNGNAPAARYRIEWRVDGKDYSTSQWGTSRSTTYTTTDQTNLANGVKYIFRVKAENGSGNSYGPYGPASEEVSATPTSGSAVDLGTPVLSNTKTLHHGMVRLDWQDIEDADRYVVQYYHVKSGEWLDLPGAGVDIAFHGSGAVVSDLHGLSWLRVRAVSCAGESEWSQIEELYGTNASDWEGVPVPEVAEGDQIDPCPVVLGTPVLSGPETLHHGMVRLDWQDIEDAGWYVVQYYHVKSGEWLDLPAAGVDIAFHGSSAVASDLHGLSWLRVRAMSCAGESEWSQIEELYGTRASDWEGVPVPEVAEGDEIEPCPEDVDTSDNSPATGLPTISGTAQVNETLTANTSGVADADGLSNVQYEYQWLADDSEVAGATSLTYTLVAEDEGKAIKVQVGFTDDEGNEESLTSAATGAVAAAPTTNSPATGAPTISGTAQVGETLTADTSGIADEDGLTNVQYEYQWLAGDAEIAGATSLTHTLADTDEGKVIRVQVSFTDDAGNKESVTSAATDAVAAAPQTNSPATGAPIISGTVQVEETLTANTSGIADSDGLGNVQYEYQWLADDSDISGAINATYTPVAADEGKAVKVRVTFTDDEGNDESLTSAATDAVSAAPAANSPATGAPTISGTAQVGETLMANTTGIADSDGLANATFSYQWLADDAEIAGATGLTYTLTDNEESRAITVQVSFTDDADNEETLTSAATAAVASAPTPNSPATGAPTITGTVQVGETLTANTSGIADADGLSNVQYEHQWLADDSDISGATNTTYTPVAADEGKAIRVQVSFTDDAGNAETLTSEATDAVAAAPTPNSPATGAPTISGTAQVGETLTADTSGIADADGLGNVQYEHQWLADDAEIAGATGLTYTLSDADEGKAISVQVGFTDDADNEETLTSATTAAVAAKPNSPATGTPTITGTAQVGQTLTADTSGIADADGLANATFSYQWLADDTDIAGANSLTYTLTDSEESKAITVQVSFTDDADNGETLTSAATDVVAAAEPSEPPAKPRGLEATAATHDQVVLTWDDPGDDSITGYVILRRVRENDTGGEFSVLVPDTGSAATTYTDDTVAASTTYTYRIKATNGAGTSERSRWFHIDIPAAPVPDKPTGLSATATHDSVTLTWNDPGDDSITGYVILRRLRYDDPKGHFDELVADTGTAAATYTDDTVAAGTSYTYRIKAINGAGPGERSRWSHIDTPAAP